MKPLLSIVSPVYKSEDSVVLLVEKIKECIIPLGLDFEIILVEDGSPDFSWARILQCCIEDKRVKGIKLSKNFGQHYAITAGLEASSGEKVIVIDCDLQDDPKYIVDLLKKSEDGYDIVYTLRNARKYSFVKNLVSKLFYRIFNFLVENKNTAADKNMGSYSLLSRKTVDAFLLIRDYHRHYLMILRWLGFNSTYINIEHVQRPHGRSSYNFKKLVEHAINGLTSQSNKLLYISVGIGLFFFVISIISVALLIVLYFIKGFQSGWASLISLILLTTGLIMLSLGITGVYIGKIFDQTKARPLYLVDKKINF